MAKPPLPNQTELLKILRYEPESGKLYWRARTPDMFASTKLSADVRATGWNTRFAGQEAFTARDKGYHVSCVRGRMLKAHRVIWCMVYGYWPDHIDHVDQDRGNNRLANLAETDREGNARNARLSERNRSGRIGVHWEKRAKRWRAKIRNGGRYIDLGKFESFEDACAARAEAEQRYGYSALHGSER